MRLTKDDLIERIRTTEDPNILEKLNAYLEFLLSGTQVDLPDENWVKPGLRFGRSLFSNGRGRPARHPGRGEKSPWMRRIQTCANG